MAIIIADNLKTHTTQGYLLVRSMLTELSDQLQLVYTPAYDPDANGTLVEVRVSHAASSRIIITARTLSRGFLMPERTLRCSLVLGSPFAPDQRSTQPQALAA